MFSWPPIVGRRKIVSGRVVIVRIKRFVNQIKKEKDNVFMAFRRLTDGRRKIVHKR